MEVVQIKNPITFTLPEVQELLMRALEKTQRIKPEDAGLVAPDILRMLYDDAAFIFLGEEEGHFKLIILGFLPVSNLFPHATVVSFYNEGSRILRDLGKKNLLDFIKEHGYNTAWAVNGTHRSNKAWKRVFGQEGVEILEIGTVFEINSK